MSKPRHCTCIRADISYLLSGVFIERLYLDKTGAGVTFNDHSVLTYFGAHFSPFSRLPGLAGISTSIRDPEVLSNYHNVFIPKAVKYSAGLLDYFFRGTMDASVVGYDADSMRYTNLIMNTCGTNLGSGTFSILYG